METFKKYVWQILLVIAIVILFVQRSCNKPNDTQTVKVTIPEKIVEIQKEIKIEYLPSKPQKIYVAGKEVITENPVNEKMVKDFILTKDSVEILKKYTKAIEEKEQIRTFYKNGILVEVKSKVRGELLKQSIVATIKEYEQNIEAPIKTKTAVYAGLGISDNRRLDNFIIQAEIGLQIKRDIIFITADTKQNFGIKYLIKL
jgi:hypothetical protein